MQWAWDDIVFYYNICVSIDQVKTSQISIYELHITHVRASYMYDAWTVTKEQSLVVYIFNISIDFARKAEHTSRFICKWIKHYIQT